MSILTRVFMLFAAVALCACSPSTSTQFHGNDITGADYGRDFSATDHHGQLRHLADFRGKVVTLFFGYTQCPDVCPTNLSNMAEVMRQMGKDADRVQVLFMTIDPERDTQALLAQYVPTFDARFLGLRADAAGTAQMAREFKVFYQKSGDVNGPNYSMDHSAGTYVFDPQGHLRLYLKHGMTPDAVAADLKVLLAQ